jgi:hypothetical protein
MTDRLAAVALRILAGREGAVDGPPALNTAGDYLVNQETYKLPNGCICYVHRNRAFYILDKDSTTPADGEAVLVPGVGPGRWLIWPTPYSNSMMGAEYLTAQQTITVSTQNEWYEQPTGAYQSTLTSTDVSPFDVDASTGRLTYNGPTCWARMKAYATLSSAAAAAIEAEIALDINAQAVGGTSSAPARQGQYLDGGQNMANLCAERATSLTTGDFVSAILRNVTDTNNIVVEQLSLIVELT